MPAPGLVAAAPAIIGLIGTVATIAVSLAVSPKKPDKMPEPKKLNPKAVDKELQDAAKRKGRQQLASKDRGGLLVGGDVGANISVGESSPTLVGN